MNPLTFHGEFEFLTKPHDQASMKTSLAASSLNMHPPNTDLLPTSQIHPTIPYPVGVQNAFHIAVRRKYSPG